MLIAAFSQYFFGLAIFASSMFLILLVLVQRGRGGGLTGALGGPGGQSAFGTKAGDLFTRITIGVAVVWIVLCAASVYFLKARGLPTLTGTTGNSTAGAAGDSGTTGSDAADALDTNITGADLPGIDLTPPADTSSMGVLGAGADGVQAEVESFPDEAMETPATTETPDGGDETSADKPASGSDQ